MEPLYKLNKNIFWNEQLLRDEFLSIDQDKAVSSMDGIKAYLNKIYDDRVQKNKESIILYDSKSWNLPVLHETYRNFVRLYGDMGTVRPHYFIIQNTNKNTSEVLDRLNRTPWHVDTKIYYEGKPLLCCLNIPILGLENKAEFLGINKTYTYKASVFNTSVPHRIILPKTPRVLVRFGFHDIKYEDVVDRIERVELHG